MNAVVYGHGVVGAATGVILERAGIAPRYWDLLKARRTCAWGDVLAANVIFLTLSTMISVDEDSKVVREEVKRLDDAGYAKQYVLRTTVAPGTADRLCKDFALVRRWCSWPEFLREATWQEDALHPDRVILGVPRYGPWPAPTEAESPVPLLKNVAGTVFPQAPVHTLTPTQAELAKLVSNALLALRISVWSELAGKYKTPQVAAFGRDDPEPMIDDAFMAAVAADQRLGSFGGVRFGAAFGGKCLPKDVAYLAARMPGGIIAGIQATNEKLGGPPMPPPPPPPEPVPLYLQVKRALRATVTATMEPEEEESADA